MFSIASSLAASLFMRRGYPLRATENLAMLYFVVLDGEVALSARPAIMRRVFAPAFPGLADPTLGELATDETATWSTQSMLLRCTLVGGFITSFGPMQLPQYLPAMAAILLFAAIASGFDPLPQAPNAGLVLVDWCFLGLTLGILTIIRVQAILVERRAFHLQREVLSLARTEIADKVRISAAEAASGARSRLIRVVMHDLRSPLLATASAGQHLASLAPSTPVGMTGVANSIAAVCACSVLMERIVSDM